MPTWLEALAVLSCVSAPRLLVSARLSLVRLPPSEESLPFRLDVRIEVSIPLSSLREDCPKGLIEHQRLFWTSLLPPSPKPQQFDAHGQTTLPFFYSILRPAPPFEHDENEQATQPADLESELFPFQRRGVRWMLEREGKRLLEDGSLADLDPRLGEMIGWKQISLPLATPPDLGDLVEQIGYRAKSAPSLWFDRLLGLVAETKRHARASPSFVDLPDRGGMLCDEMGTSYMPPWSCSERC